MFQFIKKTESKKYNFQGKEIELLINEKVFPISEGSRLFAENIRINPGEKVIDIGTGTGILAILAAKLNGNVYATDINESSILLAKENSKNNNVSINFKKGSYFADFNEKFDVIIANLPQEIITDKYKKEIGEKLITTISGGKLGNKYILVHSPFKSFN